MLLLPGAVLRGRAGEHTDGIAAHTQRAEPFCVLSNSRSKAEAAAPGMLVTLCQTVGISLCAFRCSLWDKWKAGTRAAMSGPAVAVGRPLAR